MLEAGVRGGVLVGRDAQEALGRNLGDRPGRVAHLNDLTGFRQAGRSIRRAGLRGSLGGH